MTSLTTTASVGFVVWMLRGGFLIASLLSSLPAWTFVDPLPILDEFDDSDCPPEGDDDEHDKETLESMIRRSEKRAAMKSKQDKGWQS